MRLLQVVTDDDRRGAQVFARDLGARLAEAGVEVRTVALAAGTVGGLDVEVLGARPWVRNLPRLRRVMREADVVVAHGSTTLPACALAGTGIGRPIVYRQVSDPVYWTRTVGRRLRTTVWYRRITHVVALSPPTVDVLADRFHIDRDRITAIPNAVDERRWPWAGPGDRASARAALGLPPAAPVVVTVGSLTAEKGVADLIAAADPAWHVVVVGQGPERAALERHAKQAGVTATFTGALDDPWPALSAADVIALPSRSDMHPAVVLEAALVGIPVVATDVGAVRDLVVDGTTGLVVPARDRDSLHRALAGLLADPSARTSLATAARTRTEAHHTLTAVAPRWLALLEGVARTD